MNAGIKTTEFWLNLAAITVAAVLNSGLLPEGSEWAKIVGTLGVILGALGYTAARTYAKRGNLPRGPSGGLGGWNVK